MPYKDPALRREYNRKWMASRRASYFEDKTCVKCGSSEQLELDHVDPELKATHRIWSWSEPRRDAELAKCQVLCEACHMAKTVQQLTRPPLHGTQLMYKKHGCRCGMCKLYLRNYWRTYRTPLKSPA